MYLEELAAATLQFDDADSEERVNGYDPTDSTIDEALVEKVQQLPGKKAESQRSREILRQMHFQPRHIRVCAMPTRIIILVWRQRILPKAQRKVQPVLVPGSNMVESCGSTKSWSGWRKRQIKMP